MAMANTKLTINVDAEGPLRVFYIIAGCVSVCITCLAFYFLLRHSTRAMNNFRIYLVHILAWSVALDAVFVLAEPMIYTPIMGMSLMSPLWNSPQETRVVGCLWLLVNNNLMCSIMDAFCYRYTVVYRSFSPNNCWNRCYLTFMLSWHILISAGSVCYYFVTSIDEAEMMRALIEEFPLVAQAMTRPTFVYYSPRLVPLAMPVMSLSSLFTAAMILAIAFFIFRIFRLLRTNNAALSSRSRTNHMSQTKQLIVQAIVPYTFLMIPTGCATMLSVTGVDIENNVPGIVMMYFASGHGVLSSSLMILGHRPYRLQLRRWLAGDLRELASVTERGGESLRTISMPSRAP